MIASKLNRSENFVRYWINTYNKNGLEPFRFKHTGGKNFVLNETEQNILSEAVTKQPETLE